MKHLRPIARLLLVSCLMLACDARLVRGQNRPAEPGFTELGLKQLRALMQDAVDRKQIAGAVGLLMRRGQVGFLEAVGQRDAEAGQAMTADTLFRIASMTKPVTSVAVMILVDDRRLRVEDPVSRYIPEFKDVRVLAPGVYGKDVADAPTVAPRREVTIHDLLTHTSGLVYGFSAQPPLLEPYTKAGVSDGLTQTEGTTGDNARKLACDSPGSPARRRVDVQSLDRRAGPRRRSCLRHEPRPLLSTTNLRALEDDRLLVLPDR